VQALVFDKVAHRAVSSHGQAVLLTIKAVNNIEIMSASLVVPLTVSLRVVSEVVADDKAFRILFGLVSRLVFQSRNHVVFLEQPRKTKCGGRAPIPEDGEVADACTEFAALQSSVRIIDTRCQGVGQIEPGLESRKHAFPSPGELDSPRSFSRGMCSRGSLRFSRYPSPDESVVSLDNRRPETRLDFRLISWQ
jgi:hypothetical protein